MREKWSLKVPERFSFFECSSSSSSIPTSSRPPLLSPLDLLSFCSPVFSSSSLPFQAFVSLRLDLLRPALSTLVDCLRSEPGSEPRGSYQVLKEGSKFLKERVIDSDGKIVEDK